MSIRKATQTPPSSQSMPATKRVKTITTITKPKAPAKRINTQLTSVNLGRSFPLRANITHKYVETFSHSCSAGVYGSYKFVCNGMYDPNLTGTGHQPYYFDQMAGIYDHYTVTKSTIRVTCVPTTSSGAPMIVSLFTNDDSTVVPQTTDNAAEAFKGSFKHVAQGVSEPTILYSTWDAVAMFGPNPLANDNLQGTVSTNPGEQSIWCIGIQSLDATSNAFGYFTVEINYTATWDELKDILSS